MADFYFRGTITQFWQVALTEYKHLSLKFGEERFEFFSPNPKNISFAEWQPRFFDEVHFIIWAPDHKDFPVRLKASQTLGSELVEMTVSVYTDVLQTYGESVLDVWNSFITSLDEQGLLIRPSQFLEALPQKPTKPNARSDRKAFHHYFERMKKIGYKYTYKQLAEDMGVSEGHAKRLHSNFLKEGGNE